MISFAKLPINPSEMKVTSSEFKPTESMINRMKHMKRAARLFFPRRPLALSSEISYKNLATASAQNAERFKYGKKQKLLAMKAADS